MRWERVVTIHDFYDGPRHGVAFFDDSPHVYDSIFDEARDRYSEEFWLTPIDSALLPLIEEGWRIWIRWATAHRAGETSSDTHPALPADRERYEEMKALLDPLLVTDRAKAARMLGEFRNIDIIGWAQDTEVQWSLPKDGK